MGQLEQAAVAGAAEARECLEKDRTILSTLPPEQACSMRSKRLGSHRKAIVLVGAQGVYLHVGEGDLAVSPYTTGFTAVGVRAEQALRLAKQNVALSYIWPNPATKGTIS